MREKLGLIRTVSPFVTVFSRLCQELLKRDDLVAREADIDLLLDDDRQESEIRRLAQEQEAGLLSGHDYVLFTSRRVYPVNSAGMYNLKIGQRISKALFDVLRQITIRPRYLLAKGGITSSDPATGGLGVKRALVRDRSSRVHLLGS